jgi:hypothetical protein
MLKALSGTLFLSSSLFFFINGGQPQNYLSTHNQNNLLNSISVIAGIQCIINSYVGSGWQLDKSFNIEHSIDDLYYRNNAIIAANTNKITTISCNQSDNIAMQSENNTQTTMPFEGKLVVSPRLQIIHGCKFLCTQKYEMLLSTSDFIITKRDKTWSKTIRAHLSSLFEHNHAMQVTEFNVSQDETLLAVNLDTIILVFDIQTGKKCAEIIHQSISDCGLAISPDNKEIAVGKSDAIVIYDIKTKAQKQIISIYAVNDSLQQRSVYTPSSLITYSPCGKYIILGNDRGRINIYYNQPDLNKDS